MVHRGGLYIRSVVLYSPCSVALLSYPVPAIVDLTQVRYGLSDVFDVFFLGKKLCLLVPEGESKGWPVSWTIWRYRPNPGGARLRSRHVPEGGGRGGRGGWRDGGEWD